MSPPEVTLEGYGIPGGSLRAELPKGPLSHFIQESSDASSPWSPATGPLGGGGIHLSPVKWETYASYLTGCFGRQGKKITLKHLLCQTGVEGASACHEKMPVRFAPLVPSGARGSEGGRESLPDQFSKRMTITFLFFLDTVARRHLYIKMSRNVATVTCSCAI